MRPFGLFLKHPPHTLSAHAIRTALLLFRGAAEEM